jgi:hypothetical protein
VKFAAKAHLTEHLGEILHVEPERFRRLHLDFNGSLVSLVSKWLKMIKNDQ